MSKRVFPKGFELPDPSIFRSNEQLEECLGKCNKSLEVSILLAGSKSWTDSCHHLDGTPLLLPFK